MTNAKRLQEGETLSSINKRGNNNISDVSRSCSVLDIFTHVTSYVPIVPTASMSKVSSTIPTVTTFSPMEDLNILHHILSFVGKKQYMFVATVNHNFKTAYL
jgi:hypothetical protein